MGGSKRTSTTNTQQTQSQQYGSTPTLVAEIPRYQNAVNNAISQGPYTGDVVAAPNAQSQYAPQLGAVSGRIAQGNPLDNYIATATPASMDGLQMGEDYVRGQAPAYHEAGQNLTNFWGDVAGGRFLDPNANPYLQGHIDSMRQNAEEGFARSAANWRDASISAGAYDDTNAQRGAAWMQDQYNEDWQNTISDLLYRNYTTEMDRMNLAPQGLQAAMGVGLQPTMALDALGERQRQNLQLEYDNVAAAEADRQRIAQEALDNEAAMAQWQYMMDQGRVAEETLANENDTSRRQAGLTNAAYSSEAARLDEMTQLERMFGALSSPAFGVSGEMQGTSTTTQKDSGNLFRDLLGAASTIGGAIMGGPAGAMAGASGLMKGGSAAAAAMPALDFSSLITPVITGATNSASRAVINPFSWAMGGR